MAVQVLANSAGYQQLLLVAGIVLAGIAGCLVVPVAATAAVRGWRRLGVRARLRGQTGVARIVLEGGIPRMGAVSRALLRVGIVARASGALAAALGARGIHANLQTSCQCLVVAALCVFAAGFLLTGSVVGALALCALTGMLVAWRVCKVASQRRQALLEQLPDALRALGVYYGSGLSLQQAFEHAGHDIEAPLGPLLGEVSANVRAGVPVDQALALLRERTQMHEVAFVTVAIEVQQRTGGSLQALLDRAARDVVDTLAAKRELAAKTAQSKMSAQIVAAMPVMVLLVMALVSPGYLVTFLSSPAGLAMFVVACALEVSGIMACRAILNAAQQSPAPTRRRPTRGRAL